MNMNKIYTHTTEKKLQNWRKLHNWRKKNFTDKHAIHNIYSYLIMGTVTEENQNTEENYTTAKNFTNKHAYLFLSYHGYRINWGHVIIKIQLSIIIVDSLLTNTSVSSNEIIKQLGI